ncbi:MAG: MarR family transcriptional regulator [Anaerolineaceae bacterium]|nr:MarR family transcriptional regulator [Anaerolineaceae bacterium]
MLTDDDIKAYEKDGKTILVIHIPMAKREDKPVFINNDLFGGTFRRNGEGDYHCTKSEVRAMLRDQTEDTADMKVLPDFDLEVLNKETVRLFRSRHTAWRDDHVWKDLSDSEYLERIGAAKKSREDGRIHPTGAGLLMFAEEYKILYEYPEYFLDFREMLDPSIRWTDRVQSMSGDWTGNLFDFFFRIYPKLVRDLKIPFKLEGIIRVDDTPVHKAIREALVNCLVNTDFYVPRGVVIRKDAEKIIMENPGYIRTGKEQMLKGGVSDPRNKALMKMFSMIGIGERAGSGVPGILAVWKSEGWKTPSVEEQYGPDRTILTLPLETTLDTNDPINDPINGPINDPINGAEKLRGENSLEYRVLDLLRHSPALTRNELAEHTGYSDATIKRLLKKLSDQGDISRVGSRKTGYWKVLREGNNG